MAANPFDEALELALRLSPVDKLRLVEQLASTLEKDISSRGEPTWTDEEISDLRNMKHITPAEMIAWLDANPPTERWGDLRDDIDAAEYVHQMRRKAWSTSDDALPGDRE